MKPIFNFLKFAVVLLISGSLVSCYGPIYPAYASNGHYNGTTVDPIVPVVLGAAAIGGIIYAADKYDNKHRNYRYSGRSNTKYSNNHRYSNSHRYNNSHSYKNNNRTINYRSSRSNNFNRSNRTSSNRSSRSSSSRNGSNRGSNGNRLGFYTN